MAQPRYQIIEQFDGFFAKRDATQVSPGSLIVSSQNVILNDGDRVANRSGSVLASDASTAQTPVMSMHTFKKRDGTEILMRTYGTVVEYRDPTNLTWESLFSGLTSGQVFGFADFNINTDYTDKVAFCNAVEPYMTWDGAITHLTAGVTAGATTVPVETVFQPFVFFSGSASSSTTTTITTSSSSWAADIWTASSPNQFVVRITSGANSGVVSRITANTASVLTIDTVAGLTGTFTFEIRRLLFSLSTLNLRLGGTDFTFTGLTESSLTGCSNVPTALSGDPVTSRVIEFPESPRGNIFFVDKTRIFVAGVQKSLSTVYYSKIGHATSFTFSAIRIPSEGGTIDTPEVGGAITGICGQESVIYLLKDDVVKSLYFTQDGNDLPIIETIVQAPAVGAHSPKAVFRVDNQAYYTTIDGAVKTITRVPNINAIQALQLSDPISLLLSSYDFSNAVGIFFKQKAYIACAKSGETYNSIVFVFNFHKNCWEAPIVGLNINAFAIAGNELYFGSSLSDEIYKFSSDVYDDNNIPYECIARFGAFNFGNPAVPKTVSTLFLEGYISENTTITIKLLYNYNGTQEERSTTLSGTDSDYIVQNPSFNALGTHELGLNPLGATIEATTALNKFRVYLTTTPQPFYEMSLEISSEQQGAQWEILRFGYDATLKETEVVKLKKKLS